MVGVTITSTEKTSLVFVDSDTNIYKKTLLEDVWKPWADIHFGRGY